ncbi:MAG: family 65 glycosyl hydrolase [Spirochaetaceae bacterium]|nr:family 65 glycosyl hydrolase [Spirochaetaceae bacterium]
MQYRKEIRLEDPGALLLDETLFHNANGYLGVRSNFEEGYAPGVESIRGSYINGVYDFAEMKQAEKLYGLAEEKQTILNVADTQGIKLFLGGEEFSLFTGQVYRAERILDMKKGRTERHIHWCSPQGKEVEIRIRRLASFTQLPLFLIDYSVTALNFQGNLRFVSTHRGDVKNYSNPGDPRVAAESFRHLLPVRSKAEGTASFIVSETSTSGILICTAVDHAIEGGRGITLSTEVSPEGAKTQIGGVLGAGKTLRLLKYAIFTDSLRREDCEEAAGEELRRAIETGPGSIYSSQEEYLKKFWESAFLEIDGDEKLSDAVKYNMYQLLQSAGRDDKGSMAAKGLSGEGYEGHFFWDTEMYIEPFFILTQSSIGRDLISYRYAILDEARKNARLLGHQKGALFPWRTIMGRECSGYFPAGTAQYHINGDVAWSVVSYYLATGDFEFIAEKGAEIIFECARLWIDTGSWYGGTFQLHGVTGPDEYTCMVNNNYFTNLSAKFNLQWAVRFYKMLTDLGRINHLAVRLDLIPEEIEVFSRAEKAMYIPYDAELGINPQDDSFLSKKKWDLSNTPKENFPLLLHYHPLHLYRHQVCKQADTVLAHFIFEDEQDKETIRRSFLYYEKITTHDSSLSTCIFSIAASKLGYREKAYRYFGDSAMLDLDNTHGNTKDGIHTANMGGVWMAIVYGFAGLRIKEQGLSFDPDIPDPWKGYRFRICYRDSRIQITITPSVATFTLLSGTEKKISVYGKSYTLADPLSIALKRRPE